MGSHLGYYLQLKDLRLEIKGAPDFAVCFWLYLPLSTPFPTTILTQVDLHNTKNDIFLALNEENKMLMFPLLFFNNQSRDCDFISIHKLPCVCSHQLFPLAKWVHLACHVSGDSLRLHMDGKLVGHKSLNPISHNSPHTNTFQGFILAAAADGDTHGYIRHPQLLPLPLPPIQDHHAKDPPLQLAVDYQSAYEIEEESDGVWGIVSGKASCRRKFALDVLLLDPFGKPANMEWEVVASLVYNDDRAPVEKAEDGEDALLATFDGNEFPLGSKPTKILHGRASFKLKISQLSSKCDNRLFCIKFNILGIGTYPFLETFSPPIRCISRSRNSKLLNNTWKKLPSGVHLVNCSSMPAHSAGHPEHHHNAVCEARAAPPSKRVKLGEESAPVGINSDPSLQSPHEESNSHTWEANKVNLLYGTSLGSKKESIEATDNSVSDTESAGARNSTFNDKPCMRESLSDSGIFKYCLGGLSERALMLKEIVSIGPDEEIYRFAEQIALYTGCYHHRRQILMSKRLLEEGEKTWNLISRSRHRLQWEDLVFDIEEQFMKIACCSARSLTQQDFNFLRSISGCHDYMTRENFDKMWRWLYPVACTVSKEEINGLWASTSPKWIEGFSTKEEVEYALQNPMAVQQPGTFILRFPTSRSWPHPDAGCLVVTYVGSDYSLNHRLFSSDFSSRKLACQRRSLQELLMAEPELSRLKR